MCQSCARSGVRPPVHADRVGSASVGQAVVARARARAPLAPPTRVAIVIVDAGRAFMVMAHAKRVTIENRSTKERKSTGLLKVDASETHWLTARGENPTVRQ